MQILRALDKFLNTKTWTVADCWALMHLLIVYPILTVVIAYVAGVVVLLGILATIGIVIVVKTKWGGP